MTIEDAKKLGGNEWKSSDGTKHRVYFNSNTMAEHLGLKVSRYGSGSINNATLNGESISNNQASKIISQLNMAKMWFDVKDGKMYSNGLGDKLQSIVSSMSRTLNPPSALTGKTKRGRGKGGK